jgi:hypothetical protein
MTRQRAVAERQGQPRRRRDGKGARSKTTSRLDTLRPVTAQSRRSPQWLAMPSSAAEAGIG